MKLLPFLMHTVYTHMYTYIFAFVHVFFQARRYAESLENAVWTNQFDNTANRRAHIETTGPEIWSQTGIMYMYMTS